MTRQRQYFGKYRGKVRSAADPMRLGRVQVEVAAVPAVRSGAWALPCFPVSGMFLVPEVGSNVWVEFENGDPATPIWTGIFYDQAAKVPQLARSVPPGASLFVIQTAGGAGIAVRDGQVHVLNGQGALIALTGPQVDINLGALTIV